MKVKVERVNGSTTRQHNNLSRVTDKSTTSYTNFFISAQQHNMMMSIFSPFEIAQGQKWRFSLGTGPVKGANSKPNTEGTSSSANAESKTARKDPNPSSSPSGPKQNPPRLRPRFAPEFDGLHCFESILFIPRIKLSMAMGSIFAAVPAVVAAVGFYFIDGNSIKEIKQGSSVSSKKMLAEVKERAETLQKPKFAPQLDGLHCFETL
ncbi:hypothetical protein CR513_17204, partial [Mucuna pruriens]